VPYSSDGDTFRPENSRLWTNRTVSARPAGADFDLHPDGDRVVFALVDDQERRYGAVTFVFNLFDELRRVAPPRTRP
jgi:hypothetical protein